MNKIAISMITLAALALASCGDQTPQKPPAGVAGEPEVSGPEPGVAGPKVCPAPAVPKDCGGATPTTNPDTCAQLCPGE